MCGGHYAYRVTIDLRARCPLPRTRNSVAHNDTMGLPPDQYSCKCDGCIQSNLARFRLRRVCLRETAFRTVPEIGASAAAIFVGS
jgi:hypothetical protein